MKNVPWEKGSLIGAIIAAISASLCCIGPLIMITFGIGGAWISTFTYFAFLRPIGILLTLVFLGLAFWKLYIAPKRCILDKYYAIPDLLRIQRFIFWIVTISLLLLLAFPWYVFLFY